jgi:hypothetical protein
MNVTFNVNEIKNNVKLRGHYPFYFMDIILTPFLRGILITPKRLWQFASGSPSGSPDNPSDKGYRTASPTKIPQNQLQRAPERAGARTKARLLNI